MSSVYNGVIYQPINVDVSQPNEFAPLLVKQKDAYSRGYDITLTDSGKALNISTQNSTVWFNCCNQSDTRKKASVAGTINENGTVTVIVPAVVMDVKGLIQCDISVITAVGEETHILKSTLFYLNCEAAANPDNVTSEAEESILAGIAAGTICPPGGPYVSKARKIAGIDLQDDISSSDLADALWDDLGIEDSAKRQQFSIPNLNDLKSVPKGQYYYSSERETIGVKLSDATSISDSSPAQYIETYTADHIDTAIGGKENVSNKSNNFSFDLTPTAAEENQYPTVAQLKRFLSGTYYDIDEIDAKIGNIETLLSQV